MGKTVTTYTSESAWNEIPESFIGPGPNLEHWGFGAIPTILELTSLDGSGFVVVPNSSGISFNAIELGGTLRAPSAYTAAATQEKHFAASWAADPIGAYAGEEGTPPFTMDSYTKAVIITIPYPGSYNLSEFQFKYIIKDITISGVGNYTIHRRWYVPESYPSEIEGAQHCFVEFDDWVRLRDIESIQVRTWYPIYYGSTFYLSGTYFDDVNYLYSGLTSSSPPDSRPLALGFLVASSGDSAVWYKNSLCLAPEIFTPPFTGSYLDYESPEEGPLEGE